MDKNAMLSVKIPVKCFGCSRLRTKQLNENEAIAFCKDENIFKRSNCQCLRNTDFTD